MMTSDILIKGMVCDRCISVIKGQIEKLGYTVTKISLGKVSVHQTLSKSDYDQVEASLAGFGFELASNRNMRLVAQAKELIEAAFNDAGRHEVKVKFSALLADKLNMNYDSISELFTQTEGITIEKFIIGRRLEKVKELLVYTDLTLTEIAHLTGFSSINHLSGQFKDLTGFSPSYFKWLRTQKKQLSDPS